MVLHLSRSHSMMGSVNMLICYGQLTLPIISATFVESSVAPAVSNQPISCARTDRTYISLNFCVCLSPAIDHNVTYRVEKVRELGRMDMMNLFQTCRYPDSKLKAATPTNARQICLIPSSNESE